MKKFTAFPYFRRVLVCAGLLIGLIGPMAAHAAYTPERLLSLHQTYVNNAASAMDSATRSGNSYNYYYTSIDVMGMLSAVEAELVINPNAADAEMQQVMHYVENMMSTTIIEKGHKVWGPSPTNELYNYQGAECIARTAAVIMMYPRFKTRWAAKAQSYAAFVDDLVIQRWWFAEYNGAPPSLLGDPVAWGNNHEWNDKSWLFGDILASLYQVTGNPFYQNILNEISTAFKSQFLQPLGAGWIWNYHTIPIGSDTNGEAGSVGNQEGSPDTAHANRVPVMMIFQYEMGLGGWTLSDIQRLANTMGSTLWNQSMTSPSIANYVDGSDKAYRTRFNPGANGFIFAGWALCGEFSDKAEQAAEAVMSAIETGNLANPTIHANSAEFGGYYKPVGLSGHLLRVLVKRGGNGAVPKMAPTKPLLETLSVGSHGILKFSPNPGDPVTMQVSFKAQALAASLAAKGLALPAPASITAQGDAVPLASLNLPPGTYSITAVAKNILGTSAAAQAQVTLVADDLSGMRVYPNPWRVDQHTSHPVTFDNLTVGSQIKIFTVSGYQVRSLPNSDSIATWDLKNDSGDQVASGLYLYLVTTDTGDRARGKLAVIR